MKKLFVLLILSLSIYAFCLPASCQEMPTDVPEDHYAYDAVYDLVERGINVTQGYPDGTFRGNRDTSRYENAYFMATLALSLKKSATYEIDVSDIKEEIEWLRNEITSLESQPGMKRDFEYSGSLELRSSFGYLLGYDARMRGPLGPETNYRLKYSAQKTMGRDANLKVNIDTMDGGYNSQTERALFPSLMDMEGNFSVDLGLQYPVKIKAAMGPGTVLHRDLSGVAPSEDYTYFSRPRPSVSIGTMLGSYEVTTAYVARGVASNGTVGTSEINLEVGRELGQLSFLGKTKAVSTSRYVFVDFIDPTNMPNIFRQELSLQFNQGDKLSEKLVMGASSNDHPLSQFYLAFELYMKNVSDTGTDINLKFNSVGEDYRLPFEKNEFVPLNLFNKKILDGTMDIALELTQPFAERYTLKSRSDWVGSSRGKLGKDVPGSSFTQEISIDYRIYANFTFGVFYRYYFVPSRIAQFSVVVPETSDLFGIGLNYEF